MYLFHGEDSQWAGTDQGGTTDEWVVVHMVLCSEGLHTSFSKLVLTTFDRASTSAVDQYLGAIAAS